MARNATQERILREARRMVRGERLSDFLNDYRQFFQRVRVGYYQDRLMYLNRWLVNDEQQHIDAFYSKQRAGKKKK